MSCQIVLNLFLFITLLNHCWFLDGEGEGLAVASGGRLVQSLETGIEVLTLERFCVHLLLEQLNLI